MPAAWDNYITLTVSCLLLVLVLWAMARLGMGMRDRGSRDSVRCRRCGYDLRGTTGKACPECGADLAEGVWPAGQPARRHLVDRLGLWTGVVVLLGVAGTGWFYENCRNVKAVGDIRVVLSRSNPIAIARIEAMGDTFAWPWQAGTAVPVERLRIDIIIRRSFAASRSWYDIDAETLEVSGHSAPPGSVLTADLLIRAVQQRFGLAADDELRDALASVVLATKSLADLEALQENQPLPPSVARALGLTGRDLADRWSVRLWQRSPSSEGLAVTPIRHRWTVYPAPAPPPNWMLVMPGLAVVATWLAGCWLIYRAWRKRSLADWDSARGSGETHGSETPLEPRPAGRG